MRAAVGIVVLALVLSPRFATAQEPGAAPEPATRAEALRQLREARSADPTASRALDLRWARQTIRNALQLQARRAHEEGEAARQRVELLRLRFEENLPIREVASRWKVDARFLHGQYRRARREFKITLKRLLSSRRNVPADELDQEIQDLLDVFSSGGGGRAILPLVDRARS